MRQTAFKAKTLSELFASLSNGSVPFFGCFPVCSLSGDSLDVAREAMALE